MKLVKFTPEFLQVIEELKTVNDKPYSLFINIGKILHEHQSKLQKQSLVTERSQYFLRLNSLKALQQINFLLKLHEWCKQLSDGRTNLGEWYLYYVRKILSVQPDWVTPSRPGRDWKTSWHILPFLIQERMVELSTADLMKLAYFTDEEAFSRDPKNK